MKAIRATVSILLWIFCLVSFYAAAEQFKEGEIFAASLGAVVALIIGYLAYSAWPESKKSGPFFTRPAS